MHTNHMNNNRNHLVCSVTKYGQRIIKKEPPLIFSKKYRVKKYPDEMTVIQYKNDIALLFPTGVLVDWSKNADVTTYLHDHKNKTFTLPIQKPITETHLYTWTDNNFFIKKDIFYIPKKSLDTIISLSYVLSQSIQLDYKEKKIEELFTSIEHVSEKLSSVGKIKMSSKNIKKIIGSILYLQQDIRMYGLADDMPEFFWENPNMITQYKELMHYFELKKRFQVVDQKIHILSSAIDILRDQINVKRSHILEWIIIILICFEFLPLLF